MKNTVKYFRKGKNVTAARDREAAWKKTVAWATIHTVYHYYLCDIYLKLQV